MCLRTDPTNSIPNVSVRSYSVVDRYNLLWIWMGEKESADPEKIFKIDNFDNPTWGKTPGVAWISCNYLYVTDNLLTLRRLGSCVIFRRWRY